MSKTVDQTEPETTHSAPHVPDVQAEVPQPFHEPVPGSKDASQIQRSTVSSTEGAPTRAKDMNALQRTVGNARAGKLLTTVQTKPKPKEPTISWEEALQAMDVITDILGAEGLPFFIEDKPGEGHVSNFPPGMPNVGTRWQPLVREWWLMSRGSVKYPDGVIVSYEGDILTTHIDSAVAETAPLVRELVAEGDATTPGWLAKNYDARVSKLRTRAASQAVGEAIDKTAEKGKGAELDLTAMTDIEQLKLLSTNALKTIRAVMTVSTRLASANLNQSKELDKIFATAMGSTEVPKSLETAKAESLSKALSLAQGTVYLVQAIVNISDPKARYEHYKTQFKRFGVVAGSTEFLKDLGLTLGGVTAVTGVAAFAVAKVAGKSDLAAKALTWSSQATSKLGKINIALNALGVIHGIAVLCDSDATAMEKTEAGVEAASGALGLAGRFIPAISPVTAALSASILISFHVFINLFGLAMRAYAGLLALGFRICYEDMKKNGEYISGQAMHYAAALELAGTFDDPLKVAELAKQSEAHRWNLVEFWIKPFLRRSTKEEGAGNEDPGAYSTLRRRFLALGSPKLDTPEQIFGFTKRLLETIVGCFTDAEDLYTQQVYETWKEANE